MFETVFNGPIPASFCFFSFFSHFQAQILKKTVCFSGIRTRIVRVEGEDADRLTTTTAHERKGLGTFTSAAQLVQSMLTKSENPRFDAHPFKLCHLQ